VGLRAAADARLVRRTTPYLADSPRGSLSISVPHPRIPTGLVINTIGDETFVRRILDDEAQVVISYVNGAFQDAWATEDRAKDQRPSTWDWSSLRNPPGEASYLGRMLAPNEARESPLRGRFFQVADHVVEDLPEVQAYLSASSSSRQR